MGNKVDCSTLIPQAATAGGISLLRLMLMAGCTSWYTNFLSGRNILEFPSSPVVPVTAMYWKLSFLPLFGHWKIISITADTSLSCHRKSDWISSYKRQIFLRIIIFDSNNALQWKLITSLALITTSKRSFASYFLSSDSEKNIIKEGKADIATRLY